MASARALKRVDETGAYRLGRLRLSQIPPNRMAALARYALGSNKHRNLNLLAATASPPAPCARCATGTRRSWTRTTTGMGRTKQPASAGALAGSHVGAPVAYGVRLAAWNAASAWLRWLSAP